MSGGRAGGRSVFFGCSCSLGSRAWRSCESVSFVLLVRWRLVERLRVCGCGRWWHLLCLLLLLRPCILLLLLLCRSLLRLRVRFCPCLCVEGVYSCLQEYGLCSCVFEPFRELLELGWARLLLLLLAVLRWGCRLGPFCAPGSGSFSACRPPRVSPYSNWVARWPWLRFPWSRALQARGSSDPGWLCCLVSCGLGVFAGEDWALALVLVRSGCSCCVRGARSRLCCCCGCFAGCCWPCCAAPCCGCAGGFARVCGGHSWFGVGAARCCFVLRALHRGRR